MATKKLLTIFGATGNQGGSVVDVVLSDPQLQQKYRLRGITRNASSKSAQTLAQKGVEVVSASVNDVASLRLAIRGSYGVFGVTNFWDKDVMSKKIEVQQGKNIFEACRAEMVAHYVFSALPYVEKLTDGVLKNVNHFDGKAMVAEYVEANKGSMITSYFMPAMYMKSYKDQIRKIEGVPNMIMPFTPSDLTSSTWPVLDPRADCGKYVVGLFEGREGADGVRVNGVSVWTSPQQLLAAITENAKKEVIFKPVSPKDLLASLPDNVASEITETMLLVGEYNYYGKGSETRQNESDEWLFKGTKPQSLEQVVQGGEPWNLV